VLCSERFCWTRVEGVSAQHLRSGSISVHESKLLPLLTELLLKDADTHTHQSTTWYQSSRVPSAYPKKLCSHKWGRPRRYWTVLWVKQPGLVNEDMYRSLWVYPVPPWRRRDEAIEWHSFSQFILHTYLDLRLPQLYTHTHRPICVCMCVCGR